MYTADVKAARTKSGAPFFQAKRFVSELYHDMELGATLRFEPLAESPLLQHAMFAALAAPFDPARAAIVYSGEALAGVVGEFGPSVRTACKLPDYTAGFELFLLPFVRPVAPRYQPLSRFPSISQDISLKVAQAVSYAEVLASVRTAMEKSELGDMALTWSPIGVYSPEDGSTKTVTLRLKVTSFDKTLTDSDVTPLMTAVADEAGRAVGAELS